MPARDMYADLEKIEARGKRKKEKRKGLFSSFGKKEEPKPEPQSAKPEPVPEPEPPAPVKKVKQLREPGPEGISDPLDDMDEISLDPPAPAEPGTAERPDFCYPSKQMKEQETKPLPEDPINMLEFSSTPAEEPEPETPDDGQWDSGAVGGEAGTDAEPPVEEEEPEPAGEAITLNVESEIQPPPAMEPMPAPEPAPVPETSQPAPVQQEEPPKVAVKPEAQPASEPAPITQPKPEQAPVPAVPAPAVPAKPAWQPLTGSARKRAENELFEYKKWLNRGYRAGKFTKEQCMVKNRHKEIELGLRPPE